jgi:hypothetical protein
MIEAVISAIQQRFNVEGVRHRLIAAVSGMEVIASVIVRKQMARICGIFEQMVEVDNRVESTAGAYPFVDARSLLHFCSTKGVNISRET